MAATAKPTDFTGRQRAKLAKENADALKARESEISTLQAAEAEADLTKVHDYTQGSHPVIIDSEEEIVPQGVELSDDTVVIRVAENLEMVTFGAGNHYDFEVGKQYKVPRDLAMSLHEKGYLYERSF